MDIKEKRKRVAKYEGIIFVPHFSSGQRNATFHLVGTNGRQRGLITSPINKIHKVKDQVYLETSNSVYKIIGKPKCLENIMEYFENQNFTSRDFFEKYVPKNLPPTPMGWRIF